MKEWKKEDFRDKYLSYNSEYEYDCIVQLLDSLGYTNVHKNEVYKGQWNAISCYVDYTYQTTRNHHPNYTFEQIFPKETIKCNNMEEKWCVKRTRSNNIVLNKWLNSFEEGNYGGDNGYVYCEKVDPKSSIYRRTYESILPGYKEITFEWFKEHILNEIPFSTSSNIPNLVKGRYYSCKGTASKLWYIQYLKQDSNCLWFTYRRNGIDGLSVKNGEDWFPIDQLSNFQEVDEYTAKGINKPIDMKEESLVGRWIKCLKDGEWYSEIKSGDLLQVSKDEGRFLYFNLKDGEKTPFDKSIRFHENTFELMPIGFSPPNKEQDLLSLAREKYPIGTKFHPCHVAIDKGSYCVITEDSVFEKQGDSITATIKESNWDKYSQSKYGTTTLNRVVYYQGNWAEIISSPIKEPIKEEGIPEYVECIKWEGWSHKKGIIYKVNNGMVTCEKTGTPTNYLYNDNNFKPSTFIAFQEQENMKTWKELGCMPYQTGIDSYEAKLPIEGNIYSTAIEIGDIVEVVLKPQYRDNSNKSIGEMFEVSMITDGTGGKWIHYKDKPGQGMGIENVKLISKKHSITYTNNNYKVDEFSPISRTQLNTPNEVKEVVVHKPHKRISLNQPEKVRQILTN